MGCLALAPLGSAGPEVTLGDVTLQIKRYEKLETEEERLACSREIFDMYIMKELLACSHVSARGLHAGPGRPGRGEGVEGPCGEFTATSLFSSPSRKVPSSTSRATWRRGRCLRISSRCVLSPFPCLPAQPGSPSAPATEPDER